MTVDAKTIEERKARSLLRYQKRLDKARNIREGRQFFVENNLPLLVAYPSDRPVGVYMTFFPVGKDKLRVAVALRSKKDAESFRVARGILGHRIKNDIDTFRLVPAKGMTFTAKDGGWRFKDLYEAINAIVPAELMMIERTPEWMKRFLMASARPLAFLDHRLVKHIDANWPWEAVKIAQRYYEQSWPEPLP